VKTSRSLRTVLAAVLALAVGLTLSLYLFKRRGDDWSTLRDNASGITLSHPHEWAVQRFGRYCRRNGPGILVSNLGAHTFRHTTIPGGCAGGLWKLGGLPNTFVLVDVGLFASPFPRHGDEPDTELPLELDRLERPDLTNLNPWLRARIPSGVGYAHARIVRGRLEYSVRVWTGSVSSPSNDKAVARLIRSIRVSDPRQT
jgi:hypothetical protein